MSLLKEMARFVIVLLTVTAFAVLGLEVGGLVGMFAVLFLVLVAEGTWAWWNVSHRPPSSHLR